MSGQIKTFPHTGITTKKKGEERKTRENLKIDMKAPHSANMATTSAEPFAVVGEPGRGNGLRAGEAPRPRRCSLSRSTGRLGVSVATVYIGAGGPSWILISREPIRSVWFIISIRLTNLNRSIWAFSLLGLRFRGSLEASCSASFTSKKVYDLLHKIKIEIKKYIFLL